MSIDPPRLKRDFPVTFLIALISILALVPTIVLAIFTLERWSRTEAARERDLVASLAQGAAQNLDRLLNAMTNTAEVLAGSRHLATGDVATFDTIARDAAVNASGHFVLVDPSYRQIVNTRAPVGAALPITSNPSGVRRVFDSGKPYISNLETAAVGGEKVFAILVPVHVDGKVPYVLAFIPEQRAIHDVLMERYRPPGWTTAVVDGKGIVLARTQRNAEFYGKPSTIFAQLTDASGTIETVDLEGRPSVTAYYRLKQTDWIAAAWVPKSLLVEGHNRVYRLLVVLIVGSLLISSLGSWLASELIRRPSLHLVEIARALGKSQPVAFEPTLMREANIIGESMVHASREIDDRASALQASERRLRLAIDAAKAGFWSWNLKTGERIFDARTLDITGWDQGPPTDRDTILAHIHPKDQVAVQTAIRGARDPAGDGRFDTEFRITTPNGEERWISSQAHRVATADGDFLVGIVRDITRRKIDEQKINLLMREVVHRSKNLLAVVQSIASQTARTGDKATFLPRFLDRLTALAASQTLLVESEWKGVSVKDLITTQLAHYGDFFGSRLAMDGHAVLLNPEAAQAIGMALHELGTNAAKYGALSNPSGRVDVSWHVEDRGAGREFCLKWRETGGPAVNAPSRSGFGSIVTGRMVESALGGRVVAEFDGCGLQWRLRAPAAKTLEATGPWLQ